MNHGEYMHRLESAFVIVTFAFTVQGEIFTSTCINAKADAFEWMDF